MTDASTFMGFRRDDGRVGVRNLEAVIPSCGCSLHAAKMIAAQVQGAALLCSSIRGAAARQRWTQGSRRTCVPSTVASPGYRRATRVSPV